MFEGNILTFNPGWDQHCNNLESYTDVRDIQKGHIAPTREADEPGSGPDHINFADPDGNAILIDPHR